MPLIKSISGIRGTLENIPGESLSDYDVKQFTLAYLEEIILYESSKTILVGRDASKSGNRISNIIIDVVLNAGYNVIDYITKKPIRYNRENLLNNWFTVK